MTLADAIARVKAQGGFDVSDDEAQGWVLDAYRTMVARSKWRQTIRELGLTAVGVGAVDVPEDIVDVLQLAVNGRPYDRISVRELWELKTGSRSLLSTTGVFAPIFQDDAADVGDLDQVELYTAPTEAGLSIMALAAVLPPTLGSDGQFAVPEDVHERIVDGAISTGLLRKEERPDLAAGYKAQFDEAVGELNRRRTSRIGSGPAQMAVLY